MTPTLVQLSWRWAPIAATLVLHLAIIAVFALRFSEPVTSNARAARPVAIQASLVSADSLKPKKTAKPVSKPTSKPANKKTDPPPKPKPKAQKPAPKPEVKTASAPTAESSKSKPSTEEQTKELAEQAREALSAMINTTAAPQDGVQGSVSDTVAAVIRQAVVNRWTRPPSARNGMQAVLEIALVPTGEVVGVTVLESSGSGPFDQSAINAVEKVARFAEVKQLERAIFERDFRRFQLIFRPEDLRY